MNALSSSPVGLKSIFVVEDSQAVARLMHDVVAHGSSMEWLGAAGSIREAKMALMNQGLPDVLVLDLKLPDGDGRELLSYVEEMAGQCAVLIITGVHNSALTHLLCSGRVDGAVDKLITDVKDWRLAFEVLRSGRHYFSTSFVDEMREFRDSPPNWAVELSEADFALLPEFVRGDPDEQIAENHQLSPDQIKACREKLMRVLGLESMAELILWGRRTGWDLVM